MSVGQRVRAADWDARTSGRTLYAADVSLEGTLHAYVLRSPYPHARISGVDTAAARAMPGVHGVITAHDFRSGATYLHMGPGLSDRPPLADGVVRFIGQEVAAVAADTRDQARRAAAAIVVGYERRPAPLDVDRARRSTVRLHDRADAVANVSVRNTVSWGDVPGARAAVTSRVEGRYRYPAVTHAAMETQTTLARWDPVLQRLELWTSTQVPYVVAKELSHLLGLDHTQVVCREVAVGGGFGGKSKVGEHEVLAAALARRTGRPVLLSLDRDEEFAHTKPRHAFDVRLGLGAGADGRIRHVTADLVVDNGAYNHVGPAVLRIGELCLGSMYRPDAVEAVSQLVDTALVPGGAFRGFGIAQVGFALESEIDELAARLGQDPIELRLRNVGEAGETTLSGFRVATTGLAACLETVRAELDWDAKRQARVPFRGLGVACGMHPSGSYAMPGANVAEAAVDLHLDGTLRVRFGGADPGTGQRTLIAQIVAHELGVPVEGVDVVMMDSERTPFDLGAFASRGTHMAGQAVGDAARDLAAQLRGLAAAKLGVGEVRLTDGQAVAADGSSDAAVSLGDLVGLSDLARDGVLSVQARHVVPEMELLTRQGDGANIAATYSFAAHGAEVEVDPVTGQVRVVDYVAAHDLGAPLNPLQAEGQIVGGVVMGLGAALGEELVRQDGRVVNGSFVDYAVPRAADAPRIRAVIVPGADPLGPYGAKSVGEVPVGPPPAVVANAVHDAVGVRITDLPITPDKVLSALAERDGRTIRPRILVRPSRWWIAAMRWLYTRGLHAALHRWGTRRARRTPLRAVEAVLSPGTVASACERLTEPGAVALGGGTDLMLQRRQGLQAPRMLVSTTRIPALASVDPTPDGGLRLGAAVTLHDLAEQVAERCPVLVEAIDSIASEQVRQMATLAGNLAQATRCWFFRSGFDCFRRGGPTCPCYAVDGDHRFHHAAIGAHRCQAVTPSDLATVLTALDATVEVAGPSGHRGIPVGSLYSGAGDLVLTDSELITAVTVPEHALAGRGSFTKLALRHGDFAMVSVAVTSLGRRPWANPRVVLGAMAPVPWRAQATERHLRQSGPDGALTAIRAELRRHGHPLRDNGWKLVAAAGMTERAVTAVAADLATDLAADLAEERR